ncbi:fizzy-related protein homolog [Eurytemora carolleeae]|uniref:fizzy-related protein homolog n=1 Tax=Eurytemora carolleeae TaxID=1294199 RepID=UPI000C785958|nr:fizzy-related protein homolog [Eurytemora carolleeae]|eukprot:XP_023325229.1 fizzy-related protein homolog [Eurytemora affinis]
MDTEFEKRLGKKISGSTINYSQISPQKRCTVMSPVTSPRMLKKQLTPVNSPQKEKYGDRFIPSRAGNNWQTSFSLIQEKTTTTKRVGRDGAEGAKDMSLSMYSCLLKNEVLGTQIEDFKETSDERRAFAPITEDKNLFSFRPKRPSVINEYSSPYSLSPVSSKSQKLLKSPRKASRKISKIPFKVLDAPELQDDFYLNLVDWSSQNVLSVGLGACVYLWSACTSQVTRLCDLTTDNDTVTSVSWAERGNLVAVGTHRGYVQIWDVTANKKLNVLEGHSARVGALAWNGDMLSSGSRDRLILQRDIRTPSLAPERRLAGHRQEVCGLKWSPDNQYLASGGNDNKLFVWNLSSTSPMQTYTDHLAAVKAIAWSPHHHGLLASGGGTADRCIRFWNTLTGQAMQSVDTGSQVCNLAWSKHASELVSTHGYSQNQILVWKYPSLVQVAKLTGHSFRVLYLAMSPDGEAIVTGAGDETLRFWNVFSKARSQKECKSALNLFTSIR